MNMSLFAVPILEFFQDPVVAAKVDDLVEAGRQLTFTNGNITVDWGILVAAGALALLGGYLGTISICIICFIFATIFCHILSVDCFGMAACFFPFPIKAE